VLPKLVACRVAVAAVFALSFLAGGSSRAWPQDVLTYHNNNARTGVNLAETTLTSAM